MMQNYQGGNVGQSLIGYGSNLLGAGITNSLTGATASSMFGSSIGSFAGPIGTIVGSLMGSLVGGLFKKKQRQQVTEAIAVKDIGMRDLLSQLLNITKNNLNVRGAGGVDRLNNLRLAQTVVG